MAAVAGRMIGLDLLSGATPDQDRDAPIYTASCDAPYDAIGAAV